MKIDVLNCDMNTRTGLALCADIVSRGFEAYLVGGCVRDIVMESLGVIENANVHDIDIATNMPIKELKGTYRTASNNGEAHGTILVEYGGVYFEVTQFRCDGGYSDGRHPDSVQFTSSFEEDTLRRDFTINAMGLDHEGNVIDYNGGINDIKNNVVRTVGNPNERFSEDVLRIIRAVRFAVRFNFTIEDETGIAMMINMARLTGIARERIGDEIKKAASYGPVEFHNFLDILTGYGLQSVIDPDIDWHSARLYVKQYIDRTYGYFRKDDTVDISIEPELMMTFLFHGSAHLKQAIDSFRYDNKLYNMLKSVYSARGAMAEKPAESDEEQTQNGIVFDYMKILDIVKSGYIDIYIAYTSTVNDVDPEIFDKQGILDLSFRYMTHSKALSAAVMDAGYSGKEFGIKLTEVTQWFIKQTLAGSEPTDEQILNYFK